MDQVRAGWTTKQLAAHAAEPKGKTDREWHYKSAESAAYPGGYRYCLFIIQKGVAADIRQGDGFVPEQPPPTNN